MENSSRLLHYNLKDGKVITTKFTTFDEAEDYCRNNNGRFLEVAFTKKSDDNPIPDNSAKLVENKRVFSVELDPGYKVFYSADEEFQELVKKLQSDKKHMENDVAPEDWLADQNIAPEDRIIVTKDGEISLITTRERIKYLMESKVFELGVETEKVSD